MSDERFLNSYHNASTPPGPDVPAELAAFMLAVDPVLIQAAELARVLARAHQGAATQLTDEELRTHPEWRNFGGQKDSHPPMRGWLAVPLIGFDGQNYGFIQASDRLEGDFTVQDEANLVRLATLTSAALDGLAQLHLPEYRDKVGA